MQAIINVSEDLFRYLFNNSTYSNNFTHEGLGLLYEYLESLEEEGKPKTLNIPELCMEYSEEKMADFIKRHDLTYEELVELELDEDGEVLEEENVIFDVEDMSIERLQTCILNYMDFSSKYNLIGFTDETVLFY